MSPPINPDFRAPVLCLAFNRPAQFRRVLEALEAGGPREIFVSVDGPRPGRADDAQRCGEVRELARKIDWASQLHLKLEPHNLGCGPAVSAAISWALAKTPELIIIEDDCLPDPSFLRFCDELLQRYRDDTRVMQIGGTNWGASTSRFGDHSYAFTSFAPIWGWATWRRAWQLYDFRLESWPAFKADRLHEGMAVSPRFRRLLERDWDIVRGGGGTWDHQWQYAVLRHHGLSICPRRNLVQNIGFQPDGTQLTTQDRVFSRLPLERMDFPLHHPPEVARSARVESVFERIYWQKLGLPARLLRRVMRQGRINALVRSVLHRLIPRPS